MDNITLFFCGVVVTLIAGLGIVTSEVFLGYEKFMNKYKPKEEEEDKQKVFKFK
jgi:hypothetical protein|tara:strand:+ start:847 stop:1008 length:162 start_codon:yes stop_codon:yes gene_type:complete